jgi:tetratricopeptide (TPR) repeat protein
VTQAHTETRPDASSGKQKVVLAVLAVVALGSVFLLPNFVSEPWVGDGGLNERTAPDLSASNVAPSTAAEKTRYRQDSQAVLANIIPLRDRLLEQSVEQWSPVEFQQALDLVQQGDEQYSYGDYRESIGTFELALEIMQELTALAEQKLADALQNGFTAIESLNINGAQQSAELAALIDVTDPQVQVLQSRTGTLPEVAARIESGDLAKLSGRLADAEAAFTEAVALDSTHQRATESLRAVREEMVESRFRGHMSRAYAALDAGEYDAAVAAFEEAAVVHPGHSQITQGLAQVQNRRSQSEVTDQAARARVYEQNEEWALAVSLYENLLEKDPSLTDARVRLIPARVRADLDIRLEDFNSDALRLAELSTFRRAQLALNDARGIPNAGSRLTGQIELLESLLRKAVTPVDVVFRSDNLTVVTLFRVAQLGQFEQTSLTLKPGKYIAAGTRHGFRDVRIEFDVTGEPLDEPIVVSCTEPI